MNLIQGCPPALPGSCYKCGSASREAYVDLQTDVEFHGAMYLCNECIVEMGTLIGMLDSQKAIKLKLNIETVEIERERLREELAALKDVANAISRVNSVSSDRAAADGSAFPGGDSSAPTDEAADGESGREDRTAKSSDDKGVDKFRSGSDSKSVSL